jgi:hypothetical protein
VVELAVIVTDLLVVQEVQEAVRTVEIILLMVLLERLILEVAEVEEVVKELIPEEQGVLVLLY